MLDVCLISIEPFSSVCLALPTDRNGGQLEEENVPRYMAHLFLLFFKYHILYTEE